MHIQQLSTLFDMCVYVVYAYFECMHVCIWCTWSHTGIGDDQTELRTGNPVISRNSGSGKKNLNDLLKFRFRSIRNRIGKLKIRFRLIRTEILLRKSGSDFLKPHSGRPLVDQAPYPPLANCCVAAIQTCQ